MKKVLIFKTKSCLPCGAYMKELIGVKGVEFLDIQEHQQLSTSLRIMSIPTVIYMKGKKAMDRDTGYHIATVKKIKEYLS